MQLEKAKTMIEIINDQRKVIAGLEQKCSLMSEESAGWKEQAMRLQKDYQALQQSITENLPKLEESLQELEKWKNVCRKQREALSEAERARESAEQRAEELQTQNDMLRSALTGEELENKTLIEALGDYETELIQHITALSQSSKTALQQLESRLRS